MTVSVSERFVFDAWFTYVWQARRLGFTHRQAQELATLKQAVYAGQWSEFPGAWK